MLDVPAFACISRARRVRYVEGLTDRLTACCDGYSSTRQIFRKHWSRVSGDYFEWLYEELLRLEKLAFELPHMFERAKRVTDAKNKSPQRLVTLEQTIEELAIADKLHPEAFAWFVDIAQPIWQEVKEEYWQINLEEATVAMEQALSKELLGESVLHCYRDAWH